MMVAESRGAVTREVYCNMHLRISKALSLPEDFGIDEARQMANGDWAHDIADFSGDSHVKIWLEEVKKKFKKSLGMVSKSTAAKVGGWAINFHGRSLRVHCLSRPKTAPYLVVSQQVGGWAQLRRSMDGLRALFAKVDTDGEHRTHTYTPARTHAHTYTQTNAHREHTRTQDASKCLTRKRLAPVVSDCLSVQQLTRARYLARRLGDDRRAGVHGCSAYGVRARAGACLGRGPPLPLPGSRRRPVRHCLCLVCSTAVRG